MAARFSVPMRAALHAGAIALLVVLALPGCSGGQAPQPAQFVDATPSVVELEGPLRARYTLLPTLSMNEAVARQYGIQRSAGTALLMVALREPHGDDERAATGTVSAQARDLAGRQQTVAMRTVTSGDYVDHVGLVSIGPHDVIRIDVTVDAGGRRQQFDLQRTF